MRYFISQYMDSERNGLWAVGQSWREVSHSHSQVQRGLEERLQSSPFPSSSFLSAWWKTCFCLQKCKERWNKWLYPRSLPGISISCGWDDSATRNVPATRNHPGKSSTLLERTVEEAFLIASHGTPQRDGDYSRISIWMTLVKLAVLSGFLVSH